MAHLNSAERDTSRKKQLAAVAAHRTHVMHLVGCFYLLTERSRFNNENGEDDAGFEEIVEAIREAADTTATEIRSQLIARLKLSAKRLLNNG